MTNLVGISPPPPPQKKNKLLGSQHPSPNVKNPLRIRAVNWLEIITSRDAKSACFEGSQTSCTEIISVFCQNFQGRANHEVHIVNWNTSILEVESA